MWRNACVSPAWQLTCDSSPLYSPIAPLMAILALRMSALLTLTNLLNLETTADLWCRNRAIPGHGKKKLAIFNDREKAYSVCFVDISRYHFWENTLPTDVPHLHRYLDVSWQFNSLDEEVKANSLLVRSGKLVFAEPSDYRGFTHSTIS